MLIYIVTIFTSAFLLFQVQPLIAKYILPWFGGSPSVWTSSMLFFQIFLLLGYTYSHLLISRLKVRTQVIVHFSLLGLALLQLPIIPNIIWQPSPEDNPTIQIVLLLAATIGLPYLAVSTTTPLIQAWFSKTHPGKSPYRLYALSNIGSFLALFSYPFLVEPYLTRNMQAWIWSGGFLVFVAVYVASTIKMLRHSSTESEAEKQETTDSKSKIPPPQLAELSIWMLLAATAVVLLLSFTTQMTQNIAPVPFLWVLPLGIYLLSFIVTFDNPRWYVRKVFAGLLIVNTALILLVIVGLIPLNIIQQVIVYSVSLFIFFMICHGELYRLKPNSQYLTTYYLTISVGGALGGIFVALIAPAVFDTYLELYLGIQAICLLAVYLYFIQKRGRLFPANRMSHTVGRVGVMSLLLALVVVLFYIENFKQVGLIASSRDFYGTLKIVEFDSGTAEERTGMVYGKILHGVQYNDEARRELATSYYSEGSGVGLTLLNFRQDQPRHIGIIGLGTGTLAVYGKPDDRIRFYEISPNVRNMAEEYFTFLQDTPADVQIIMGDGRISLEDEEDQNFDVLILDAFTNDSIPIQLLTNEAFEIYLRHLKPDGILALHISNNYLTLEGVVRQQAEYFGLDAVQITKNSAYWMLLSYNQEFLQSDAIVAEIEPGEAPFDHLRLWTDEYVSLFPILQLGE